MYNILHVIGHIGRGGDTIVVLDVLKNMNTSQFHFDFVTHDGAKKETVNELRKNGVKVYIMKGDVRELGIATYCKQFLKILRDSEIRYDAIHVHTGMQSGVALFAAKKAGISKRICHSHVTAIQRKTSALKKLIATPIFRFLYMNNSTLRVACSKDAGKFMYGNKVPFTVIYNGVDILPYLNVTLDEARKFRSELGLSEENVVIGHVARMCEMKNQKFLVELAEELKNDKNIKFLLIGDGEDFEKIKELSDDLPNIILTGRRSDIPIALKSCDCVLLPSLPGEGFPVSMIEAQAAGCQCIISENVTDEVEVGMGLVKRIPLNDRDSWAKAIKSIKRNADFVSRGKCSKQLIEMGFGKSQFVDKWLKLYTT